MFYHRDEVIPEGGLCVNGFAPVFRDIDYGSVELAAQAIAACNECPVLDECGQKVGSIAIQIRSNRSTLQSVIAGATRRWEVDPAPISSELVPPLPDDPEAAVGLLRRNAKDGNFIGKLNSRNAKIVETLQADYAAQIDSAAPALLGDAYTQAWRILAMSLLDYRPASGRPDLSDKTVVFPIASVYFSDILQIREQGLRRPVLVAMRFGPQDIQDMREHYRSNPDVNWTVISSCINTNVTYPEFEIENYLLRLALFREQYKDDPLITDGFLRRAVLPIKKDPTVAIEEMRSTFGSILDEPRYKNYPRRVLSRLAIAGSERERQMILYGYSAIGALPLVRLDAPTKNLGLDKHQLIADTQALTPEDQYLEKESNIEDRSAINGMLFELSAMERYALALVFELDWLQNETAPDELTLHMHFQTNDLERYVHEHIIPKLRPITA